jgi:hypothetical protein
MGNGGSGKFGGLDAGAGSLGLFCADWAIVMPNDTSVQLDTCARVRACGMPIYPCIHPPIFMISMLTSLPSPPHPLGHHLYLPFGLRGLRADRGTADCELSHLIRRGIECRQGYQGEPEAMHQLGCCYACRAML